MGVIGLEDHDIDVEGVCQLHANAVLSTWRPNLEAFADDGDELPCPPFYGTSDYFTDGLATHDKGTHDLGGGSSSSSPRGRKRALPSIGLLDLREMYHLQSDEAARSLGIGSNTLKRLLQKFGIARWPQRKLSGLIALYEQFTEDKGFASELTEDERLDVQALITSQYKSIIANPNETIDPKLDELRKRMHKRVYVKRARLARQEGSGGAKSSSAEGSAGSSGRISRPLSASNYTSGPEAKKRKLAPGGSISHVAEAEVRVAECPSSGSFMSAATAAAEGPSIAFPSPSVSAVAAAMGRWAAGSETSKLEGSSCGPAAAADAAGASLDGKRCRLDEAPLLLMNSVRGLFDHVDALLLEGLEEFAQPCASGGDTFEGLVCNSGCDSCSLGLTMENYDWLLPLPAMVPSKPGDLLAEWRPYTCAM